MTQPVLRLYVAGSTPNSVAAIRNLEAACIDLPTGSFEVEVIDVLARPRLAAAAGIIVTPTLVVQSASGSSLRVLGSLSDSQQLSALLRTS